MDCVDLRLYLAGQGQPGDRHVGVQHLELGLQRQSHAGGVGKKNREKEVTIQQGQTHTHRPSVEIQTLLQFMLLETLC